MDQPHTPQREHLGHLAELAIGAIARQTAGAVAVAGGNGPVADRTLGRPRGGKPAGAVKMDLISRIDAGE